MVIEPLRREHDRSSFDCGEESLNVYLTRYARQNADRDLGVTFVAVAEPGATRIEGYYTLSSGSVARETIPEERLPQYPVPTALLARLAVDRGSQGKGLGKRLLFDALRRSLQAAQEMGIYAVEVVALNEEARHFYEKYGFRSLIDDPLHLYLSMKTIRNLGL